VYFYIPEDSTLTLVDNTVTGAQINYLVGGLDVSGELIISGNISNAPRDTGWQGASGCFVGEIYRTWGLLDFVAFNPTIEGWTELEVYCER
jgi:hypothetical protein